MLMCLLMPTALDLGHSCPHCVIAVMCIKTCTKVQIPPSAGGWRLIYIQGPLLLSIMIMSNLSSLAPHLLALIYSRKKTAASIYPPHEVIGESSTWMGTHMCPSTAQLTHGRDVLPIHLCPTAEALLMLKHHEIPEMESSTSVQALNYRCAWSRGAGVDF